MATINWLRKVWPMAVEFREFCDSDGEAELYALSKYHPEIADQIRGTVHDPSEDPSRIGSLRARANYLAKGGEMFR